MSGVYAQYNSGRMPMLPTIWTLSDLKTHEQMRQGGRWARQGSQQQFKHEHRPCVHGQCTARLCLRWGLGVLLVQGLRAQVGQCSLQAVSKGEAEARPGGRKRDAGSVVGACKQFWRPIS